MATPAYLGLDAAGRVVPNEAMRASIIRHYQRIGRPFTPWWAEGRAFDAAPAGPRAELRRLITDGRRAWAHDYAEGNRAELRRMLGKLSDSDIEGIIQSLSDSDVDFFLNLLSEDGGGLPGFAREEVRHDEEPLHERRNRRDAALRMRNRLRDRIQQSGDPVEKNRLAEHLEFVEEELEDRMKNCDDSRPEAYLALEEAYAKCRRGDCGPQDAARTQTEGDRAAGLPVTDRQRADRYAGLQAQYDKARKGGV